MKTSRRQRRGLVLIIVLVCVFLMGVLLVAILQLTLRRYRAIQTQTNRAQASCLAESGLRLAAAQLERDRNYPGETWEISAASFGGPKGATVTIEVKPADKENVRRIKATADYPEGSIRRARISKEMTMQYNKPDNKPENPSSL